MALGIGIGSLGVAALLVGAGLYLGQPAAFIALTAFPFYFMVFPPIGGSMKDRLERPRMLAVAVLSILPPLVAGVALVVPVQAWTSPKWPGVREATSTPDACAVVDGAMLTRLVPGPWTPESGDATSNAENETRCAWETQQNASSFTVLTLEFRRFVRSAQGGAASLARKWAADQLDMHKERARDPASDNRTAPVTGLGDSGWIVIHTKTTSLPNGFARGTVVTRLGNVVVLATYFDKGLGLDPARAEAGVVEAARAAIDAVTIT